MGAVAGTGAAVARRQHRVAAELVLVVVIVAVAVDQADLVISCSHPQEHLLVAPAVGLAAWVVSSYIHASRVTCRLIHTAITGPGGSNTATGLGPRK
jgi:hypothetical protein